MDDDLDIYDYTNDHEPNVADEWIDIWQESEE